MEKIITKCGEICNYAIVTLKASCEKTCIKSFQNQILGVGGRRK
jgi:hypothetical protein